LARGVLVPLVDREADDQQGGRDPYSAITDNILLVLFEKGDGEPNFLGKLVGF
jgi:hypothetical protein